MKKSLRSIFIPAIILSLIVSGISCTKPAPVSTPVPKTAPTSPPAEVSQPTETKSNTEQILENVKAYINVTFLLYNHTYKNRDEKEINYYNSRIIDYKNGRQPDDSDMKLGEARYDSRNTLYSLPQIQENLAIVRVTIQRWDKSDKVFDILLRHETFQNKGGLSWYDWAVVSVTLIR